MSKVVIVVPTYNEKENIKELINKVLEQQEKIKDYELSVLISDSHSSDGTLEIIREISQKNRRVFLLDVKERGIGVGLLKGYQYAVNKLGADIIVQMDADLQHDPNDIPRFLEEFKNGVNFVQGSRFIKGGANKLEWYRQLFSWGANLIARFLMGLWQVHEFTTSYRAFTADLFKKIDTVPIPWRGKSFVFQPAFLYAAYSTGANIKEIPIIFIDRKRGHSKMDTLRYIKDLLIFSLKTRIKKLSRFFKFAIIGFIGLVINTLILRILVERYLFHPALANAVGAEMAIISNFIWNNLWTFGDRKITSWRKIAIKFLQFNLTSLGAIIISTTVVWLGVYLLGKENYMVYYLLGIATAMFWNYFMYSKVIWKKKSKI